MRTFIKSSVVLLLLVSALIIVPPRVWVKNKKAKLTYNGHISEELKLFHGNNGRLLFYLPEQDATGAYIYTSQDGLWRCGPSSFTAMKLIAISKLHSSGCAENGTGAQILPAIAEAQSIQFKLHDVPVAVSWQTAPR
jgi:hypothetical protein